MYFSPIKFVIGIATALILQHLFFLIAYGKAPQIKQPLDFQFDTAYTNNLLRLITQAPRYVSSDHYNKTASIIFKSLSELSSLSHKNYQVSFSFNSGNFTATSDRNILHFQNDIRTVMFTLNSTNLTKPPLIFSAHYDSHSITSGTYDDAINVAMMFGIAKSILSSNRTLKQPIIFLFIGSEEMGLHGSQLFMQKHPELKGNVLNLESLGTGRPFGLIWKAKKSFSVVKSFSKTNGALVATFFTDITRFKLLKSRSDLEIYERYGLSGGQTVFFGNPTLYHTALDRGETFQDIEYVGNLLTQFAFSFESEENEKDVVAFGFSPLVLIIDRSIYNIIAYSISILAITTVFFLRVPLSSFLWTSGVLFGTLFWYIFYGSMVNYVNPLSFASDIPFWFYIIVLSGVFIFLLIECSDETPDFNSFKATQLILEAVFLSLAADFDISIIFILSIIPHIIFAFVPYKINYIIELLLTSISLIPLCFMNSFLYPIVIGYMNQVPGVKAGLLPIIIIAFYCLYICMSILSISHTEGRNIGINNYTAIQVVLVFIIAVMFMAPCFKKMPYSLKYPLLVSQAEYIYENLSATISMMPVNGQRGIDGIRRDFIYSPQISVIDDFNRIDAKGPAFVQFIKKVKLPKWVNEWPKFEFVDVSDSVDISHNERRIAFNVLGNISIGDFESLVIVPHCHDGPCLKSASGYNNITFTKNDDDDDICILRFTPVCTGRSIDLVLNTHKKVDFDILFTTSKISTERNNFKRHFKSYVQQYAKSYYVADTVLFSSRLV